MASNNNNIKNILLLLVIGFIIYQLTKPPSNQINEPFNSLAPPYDVQNEEDKTIISDDMIKQILAETDETDNKIHQFKPNENNDDFGAELTQAFDVPDVQKVTPDLVNTNKNNVSKYDAKDYLPKEINDQWFDTDFSQAKFNINDDKLINTEKYIVGINTVGQSLKNASYDIRGTVPNPKFSVSPWNNSTYEADYNIKSLC
jgi:hypothetical protein